MVNPPRLSVVAAVALTTLPSISEEIADDAAKPEPLMFTVLPLVNELGVIDTAEFTVKPVVTTLNEASDIVSV